MCYGYNNRKSKPTESLNWEHPQYLIEDHHHFRLVLPATIDRIFITIYGELWRMAINLHCPGHHYTWAIDLNNEAFYTLLSSAPELIEPNHELGNVRIGTLIEIIKLNRLSRICINGWIKDLQKYWN